MQFLEISNFIHFSVSPSPFQQPSPPPPPHPTILSNPSPMQHHLPFAVPKRHKLAASASFKQISRGRSSSSSSSSKLQGQEGRSSPSPSRHHDVSPLAGSYFSLSKAYQDAAKMQQQKEQEQERESLGTRRSTSASTIAASDVASLVSVSSLTNMDDLIMLGNGSPTSEPRRLTRGTSRRRSTRRMSKIGKVRSCSRSGVSFAYILAAQPTSERNATERNATERNETERNATQRNTTQQLSRRLSRRASMAILAAGELPEGGRPHVVNSGQTTTFAKPDLSRRRSAFGLPIFSRGESQAQVGFERREVQ